MKAGVVDRLADGRDRAMRALQAVFDGAIVMVADVKATYARGALVVAGRDVTPEHVNFMAACARGIVGVAMLGSRLDALAIPPMSSWQTNPRSTAHRVTVDARTGITSGISAADRACTLRALADENSTPEALVRPGHVQPIEVTAGGVLSRPGLPEAAYDVVRLGHGGAAAVICELVSKDRERAWLPALLDVSTRYGVPMVTVDELTELRTDGLNQADVDCRE